ncbi:Hypothetical predicted protein [Xyrichtys novacula]|uniref:Uncharacterized protein n=1 Tax=Xyrichtys novacula TaxID=13765 RepID=A0AAV1EWF5_XYRNO|nr:Hypothetical predicted protein [Xyrichtys novacula]
MSDENRRDTRSSCAKSMDLGEDIKEYLRTRDRCERKIGKGTAPGLRDKFKAGEFGHPSEERGPGRERSRTRRESSSNSSRSPLPAQDQGLKGREYLLTTPYQGFQTSIGHNGAIPVTVAAPRQQLTNDEFVASYLRGSYGTKNPELYERSVIPVNPEIYRPAPSRALPKPKPAPKVALDLSVHKVPTKTLPQGKYSTRAAASKQPQCQQRNDRSRSPSPGPARAHRPGSREVEELTQLMRGIGRDCEHMGQIQGAVKNALGDLNKNHNSSFDRLLTRIATLEEGQVEIRHTLKGVVHQLEVITSLEVSGTGEKRYVLPGGRAPRMPKRGGPEDIASPRANPITFGKSSTSVHSAKISVLTMLTHLHNTDLGELANRIYSLKTIEEIEDSCDAVLKDSDYHPDEPPVVGLSALLETVGTTGRAVESEDEEPTKVAWKCTETV